MKWAAYILTFVVVAAVAAYGGYWYAQHAHPADASAEATTEATTDPAATDPAEDPKPNPVVAVTPLVMGPIADQITVYGSVQTRSGAVLSSSVPFETRVTKVLVATGQSVEAGAELMHVEPSPDVIVSVRDAQNAVAAAEQELKQVQQRYNEHLATNVDLNASKQTEQAARLRLQSLVERGADQPRTLKADAAGVVGKVNVQAGQIVSAGTSMLDIAAGDRGEVRLNVDPVDAAVLKPGQVVHLHAAGSDATIDGTIRTISRRLDPATRQVEVLVDPPAGTHLLLESFITAELDRATAEGLIVPRDAALPNEEGHFELFTVEDGHAVKHEVKLGIQTNEQVQVIGDDLKPGQAVVIEGNAELEDGMDVRVEAAKKEAAPEPTTEPMTEPKIDSASSTTTEAAS